jgi:phage shock protein C
MPPPAAKRNVGDEPKERIMETARRLTRSVEDRQIAGVCAGIAKYMGWDVALVRVAYVVLSIASIGFPGVLVYIIMWIVVPEE